MPNLPACKQVRKGSRVEALVSWHSGTMNILFKLLRIMRGISIK
ncbi:MAG TPA: hypothetical protein PKD03_11195 [Ignavibacteriaceae bacterium]|nr:hypothetical protein [Ignavibacteriaceae bacterium]